MPKLKALSGSDVVKIFEDFGFVVIARKGSHIKLRRTVNGVRQTLTIPDHRDLDKGTLRAICSQAAKYAPEADLHGRFYTE